MEAKKHGREFGIGTFLGNSGEDFVDKPLDDQVLDVGWSHACPVVDEVVKEYGAEWTLKRYAECNFVFGLVVESAKDLNPKLHKMLTTPVPRLKDELPGREFKPQLIPKSFEDEMSPLSTPWGYAIPRVVIEGMGRGDNNNDRTPERILKTLNLIDEVVKKAKTPVDLLVYLSEKVIDVGADPKVILSHVLVSGVLAEEGCWSIFKKIKSVIDKKAPRLKNTYDRMSLEEKSKEGIINF